MGSPQIQPFDLILPFNPLLPTGYATGNEVENVTDILEHTSKEVWIQNMWFCTVHVTALEVVAIAAPGNLQAWVELSPVPSTTSTSHWSAIGGGGGALPPVAPLTIVGTGVNNTIRSEMIPWQIHNIWARVVVQMPVAGAGGLADHWHVQVYLGAKKP